MAWTFEVEDPERDRLFSSPAVYDGTLYFGSTDRSVYAVDVTDGTERWSTRTDAQVNVSPTVADDVVYIGNGSSTVLALDPDSGEPLWTYDLGEGPIVGQIIPSGERLFVAHHRGGLVALEASGGDSGGTTESSGDGTSGSDGDTGGSSGSDSDSGGTSGSDTSDSSGSTDGSDGGSSDDSERSQRGFFSNSEEGEPEFLSNITNLTVLGFLLSIAGILHQMIGGD